MVASRRYFLRGFEVGEAPNRSTTSGYEPNPSR